MQEKGDKWGVFIVVPFATCQMALQNNYLGLDTQNIDIKRFNDLLNKLIQNSCLFVANGNDTLFLNTAKIKLGHEVEIYYQINKVVPKLDSVTVLFNAFSSLRDQNTIFRIFQSGKAAGNFILNTENKYKLSLKKSQMGFSVIDYPSDLKTNKWIMITLISVLLLTALFFFIKHFPKLNIQFFKK
ncbi:hypothetical protein [Arcticibacter svalbardensis]|nr:hypothetical protein [Arcticibacter svalbardensis]